VVEMDGRVDLFPYTHALVAFNRIEICGFDLSAVAVPSVEGLVKQLATGRIGNVRLILE
jgi:hypothetical protein